MNLVTLGLLPIGLGLVGAFTPCALGVNAVFLGYTTGKPRLQRLKEWLAFALARAAFLTALGLAFGLLGRLVGDFVRSYQQIIAWGLIVLGVLFIASRFYRLPLPSFSLIGQRSPDPRSALALGAVFGLDVPACTSPLILGLLAQTVLVGDYFFGATSLFLFGLGMSLPLLLVSAVDGPDRWLAETARRYRTAFYVVAGGLLIVAGAAELSPLVMSVVGGWMRYLAEPLLGAF